MLSTFAVCLHLQTPPDRTIAFLVMPFVLVAAVEVQWLRGPPPAGVGEHEDPGCPPLTTSFDQPLSLSITPTPGFASRSMVLLFPGDSPPIVAVGRVVHRDGTSLDLPESAVRYGPGTIIVDLDQSEAASADLLVSPLTSSDRLYLREVWVYPAG